MILFFIGFIFVFLDFPITVGTGSVDVLPNVVGYALTAVAAHRLLPYGRRFARVRLISILLGVVSVAEIFLALFIPTGTSILPAIVSIVSTLAFLLMTYEIAAVTKEIEARANRPVGADKLMTAWGFIAIGSLFAYVPLLMPSMTMTSLMLQLLSYIWFLYSLYLVKSKTGL